MAKTFVVTEEDLFNFDEFCGSKYDDETCRKYGFFKVKLDAACAGQSSQVQDFFKQFGTPAVSKVSKSILLENSNPCDKDLFGLSNIKPLPREIQQFLSASQDPASFRQFGTSPNCCLKALQEGEEAFLHHFYAEVTKFPKMTSSNVHQETAAIRKRVAVKQVAFEKRQSFKAAKTAEGKGRTLEMAMLEDVVGYAPPQCQCDICKCYKIVKPGTEDRNNENSLLYCSGVEEMANNFLYMTNNFAMAHLCFQNILTDLDSVYGGLSYPALYLGGLHSIFPIHVEDLSLWSFNFNLQGHPKYWLIVPPTAFHDLSDALCRRGFNGCNKWCRNLLGHKFYFPTVEFFKQESIPFEVVIQQAGEGVVVFPNAAHVGGNLGPNLAQACNFGNKQWIPYGAVAPSCTCMPDTVHADLTDLVALHRPDILKAFLSNSIRATIQDEYFNHSILVPRMGNLPKSKQCSASVSNSNSSAPTIRSRIKCPLCSITWSSARKSLIMNHLNRHHKALIAEKSVSEFLDKCKLNGNIQKPTVSKNN